jgi:acyl-CoA thioester hydrolase
MQVERRIADYTHYIKRQVCLYETDAFGHANNVTYLQYMEIARFEMMKEMKLFNPDDILSFSYILARAECDYKQISKYNDILVVYSRVLAINRSSFTLDHVFINEKTGVLVATGKVVMVSYDHTVSKTRPLTDLARESLEAYQ